MHDALAQSTKYLASALLHHSRIDSTIAIQISLPLSAAHPQSEKRATRKNPTPAESSNKAFRFPLLAIECPPAVVDW